MATPTLYHCTDARSLRPLWALEELGLDYQLVTLPFPPRYQARDYLEINPLGTVPLFLHGDTRMTESTAICQYLVARHGPTPLAVTPDEPDHGRYLNWLHFSDATLTFPQTLVLRYTQFEAERGLHAVADDYARWFAGRLTAVEAALDGADHLAAGRFTIADIAVAYGLYLSRRIPAISDRLGPHAAAYLDRMMARPALQRAIARQSGPSPFG